MSADRIDFTPRLADPPPRKRGRGAGRPEGPAKLLARQHPGCWVLARVLPGRRSGHGMLDSASEWEVAIRWLDGNEFGIDGVVTATYIRLVQR